jgi:hypothetical protein
VSEILCLNLQVDVGLLRMIEDMMLLILDNCAAPFCRFRELLETIHSRCTRLFRSLFRAPESRF